MRVISISNIQCGLLKKGTTWFHITYKRKHQQIETVLKTANIWAKGSFSYIAQIEKANLQMPHASFLALIQLFARSHSCLYFPLWQCLTIIVNSVFSHSRVFFLQPLNCHNTPLWRRFGGGLWRGRCFRNEQMSHEDWTHAKTAGRTICMNSLCDEMQSTIKAVHSVWYLSQQVTTSITSQMLSQGMCSAILLCSLYRVTLDVLGMGWQSQWLPVKIIFPLWALWTRPFFKRGSDDGLFWMGNCSNQFWKWSSFHWQVTEAVK